MTNGRGWGVLHELCQRPQWCFTYPDPDPKRVKAPRTGENRLASVTAPSEWMTFEAAMARAQAVGGNVGYVLTEDDPYCCIDLDVVDEETQRAKGEAINPALWTTQEQFDRFWKICQAFDSYTELSKSGKGLHVWIKGRSGPGLKRDGVEVYSQERFIICTGIPVIEKPIRECQELLDHLVADIRRGQKSHAKADLVELPEEITDAHLLEIAMSASNSDKFNALCRCTSKLEKNGPHGTYIEMGYKSQSEADLALMSIFTFYSKSNEQCRRLFRMSGLGQREKAWADDRYLNETLSTIRGRQAAEEAVELSAIHKSAELAAQYTRKKDAPLLHVPGGTEPVTVPPPPAAAVATLGPAGAHSGLSSAGLPWPPGMAGQIAHFIYQSAPRPVKEVAIVATLGFLAGVCGKAFCIPQSGLNLYIVLIARSAIGKEAMHSGIAALISAAASRQPPVIRFVDFNDFASGPALTKAVAANPSFVNVSGEWGKKLRRLALEDGRDGPMQQLRTVMTNLYQKSGPQSIVGGLSYSNKENNVASVSGVAYSMIGETTPGVFYDSLTQGMMEDGFLSRFNLVEYNGERPPLNTNPLKEPNKALGDAVADLCTHALTLNDRMETVALSRTNRAAEMMQAFEVECDNEINGTDEEMWRQMWNRASLKMMRVAALLAVADNWLSPVIDAHHVEWALELVRRDINVMSRRIQTGDVGTDDDARERKLAMLMREYLERPVNSSYGIPETLQQAGIIPRKYIQIRTARQSAFTSHRIGATAAMDQVIRSMCDSGYIMEMSKEKMVEKFNFHGKAYRILHIPEYKASKL